MRCNYSAHRITSTPQCDVRGQNLQAQESRTHPAAKRRYAKQTTSANPKAHGPTRPSSTLEEKSSKGPTSTSIPIRRTNEPPIYLACPLADTALHLNRYGTRSEFATFQHPADG